MMQVLDEAGFEGGVLQAVRVEDRSGIPRFYLVRNEGAAWDEALLHGQVGYESEAALRIGFLGATRSIRTWHARRCTGWCGLAVGTLGQMTDGSVLETAHWWVEAHGLWIDLSAERFDEYVRGPLAAVHLMPARVSLRYRELGPAETAEYEDSELVREVLAELAVRV